MLHEVRINLTGLDLLHEVNPRKLSTRIHTAERELLLKALKQVIPWNGYVYTRACKGASSFIIQVEEGSISLAQDVHHLLVMAGMLLM